MREVKLESSQHYEDGSRFLNPKDLPIERHSSEFESSDESPEMQEVERGDCKWFDGKRCTNGEVFEEKTEVNGGFCSLCEDWEEMGGGEG